MECREGPTPPVSDYAIFLLAPQLPVKGLWYGRAAQLRIRRFKLQALQASLARSEYPDALGGRPLEQPHSVAGERRTASH